MVELAGGAKMVEMLKPAGPGIYTHGRIGKPLSALKRKAGRRANAKPLGPHFLFLSILRTCRFYHFTIFPFYPFRHFSALAIRRGLKALYDAYRK